MTTLFGCDFHQPALPNFAALVYPHPRRHSLGWMGEVTVSKQLETAGYQVSPGRPGQGDLHAINRRTGQTHYIEVKTAMQAIDHKWRFTLWKNRHTDFRYSDLVILLAVLADFTYIAFTIPVPHLGQRSQLCITSHPASYKGWLAPYRLLPPADLLSASGVSENPLSEVKGDS